MIALGDDDGGGEGCCLERLEIFAAQRCKESSPGAHSSELVSVRACFACAQVPCVLVAMHSSILVLVATVARL